MIDETHYGNFAEPKETKMSKRGEDVLLTTLDSLEKAMRRIRKLERENKKLKDRIHSYMGQLEAYETRQIYEGELE